MNKKITLKKWLLLVSIISSDVVYAQESPKTVIWGRQINNCTENYIFSEFSNIFTIISGTGKKILGRYTEESIKNSDRVKLSLVVDGDNGVTDCFNNLYNYSGKILTLYSSYNTKSNMLQLSESKTGYYFGFFAGVDFLDKKTDAITFQLIFNQLLAEIKAKNEKLRRTSNQQNSNSNIGAISAQSAANHASTIETINNNVATSDHYNSLSGEYEGNW